jgi:hypothetical protein
MKRRSPIDEPPLRAAAQSLQEDRFNLVLDRLLMPAVIAIVFVVQWLGDLWRSYTDAPPTPWVSGLFALIAVAYAGWRIKPALNDLHSLRLGIEGERSVGQGLEELRQQGYAVYHDIVGTRSNVDHVLVGPAGGFTVETKAQGKLSRGKHEILVQGDAILANGQPLRRDPAPQARWQAKWIFRILRRSTGRAYPVVPIIVFPGWFVTRKSKPAGLHVMNDKELPRFLSREPRRLNLEEISMARTHLEMFIRAQDENRRGGPLP